MTPRQLELVELALESAAQACQASATLRRRRDLDPLAREYLEAADAVRELYKRAQREGQP